jgi:hypothetical protein
MPRAPFLLILPLCSTVKISFFKLNDVKFIKYVEKYNNIQNIKYILYEIISYDDSNILIFFTYLVKVHIV